MKVATSESSVGVRELRDALSRHLARVREGETVIVTDHGRPIARIVPIDGTSRFEQLLASGVIRPPRTRKRQAPTPIVARGIVSDLINEQRR